MEKPRPWLDSRLCVNKVACICTVELLGLVATTRDWLWVVVQGEHDLGCTSTKGRLQALFVQ